jgi:hypothetical protein
MKGAFHAGPTIEPFLYTYMTARLLADTGAFDIVLHTLVVRHRNNDECEKHPPHAEIVEDGRDYAIIVELCNHVGDFCVRRGRDEARIDSHGEVAKRLGAKIVGKSVSAQRSQRRRL